MKIIRRLNDLMFSLKKKTDGNLLRIILLSKSKAHNFIDQDFIKPYATSALTTTNDTHLIMTSTTENENIDLDLEEILEDEELEENQDDDNGILEDEEDNQTAKFDVRPTVSGVLNLRTNKEHIKFFHKGCKPPYDDFNVKANELTAFIQSFSHKAG